MTSGLFNLQTDISPHDLQQHVNLSQTDFSPSPCVCPFIIRPCPGQWPDQRHGQQPQQPATAFWYQHHPEPRGEINRFGFTG